MKILRFFRNLIVLICWTVLFTVFSNSLIDLIWHFDFLSDRSWTVLNTFWNSGGIIKTTSDVLLLTSLALLPLLWFLGFILIRRLNFLQIFLFPINFVLNLFRSLSSHEDKRIVLKNLKSGQQAAEDLKLELEAASKPKKAREAEGIRSEIIQKRSEK